MNNKSITPDDILEYWFSQKSKQYWFASTLEIDNEIREKYEDIWNSAASGELNDWQDSAEGSLALIIIFDQFPLNMFRGYAKAFKTCLLYTSPSPRD